MLFEQDCVNRTYMRDERDHPQTRDVRRGAGVHPRQRGAGSLDGADRDVRPARAVLLLRALQGALSARLRRAEVRLADYAPVDQTPEQVRHARLEYAALLSMCGPLARARARPVRRANLCATRCSSSAPTTAICSASTASGRRIICRPTRRSCTRRCSSGIRARAVAGERRESLVQTIDLPATLLSFFGVALPEDMQGRDLLPVLLRDEPVRDGALFGLVRPARLLYRRPLRLYASARAGQPPAVRVHAGAHAHGLDVPAGRASVDAARGAVLLHEGLPADAR